MNTLTKIFLLLALALGSVALSAPARPDFSGEWELNLQKSDLGGAPITKLNAHIDHKDPVFKYTAKAVTNGQDFEESGTILTDGKPTQDSRGAMVKAHWENTILVVETSAADGSPLDEARMTLAEDGKTMIRDYVLKSGDGGQKRHEVYDKG